MNVPFLYMLYNDIFNFRHFHTISIDQSHLIWLCLCVPHDRNSTRGRELFALSSIVIVKIIVYHQRDIFRSWAM